MQYSCVSSVAKGSCKIPSLDEMMINTFDFQHHVEEQEKSNWKCDKLLWALTLFRTKVQRHNSWKRWENTRSWKLWIPQEWVVHMDSSRIGVKWIWFTSLIYPNLLLSAFVSTNQVGKLHRYNTRCFALPKWFGGAELCGGPGTCHDCTLDILQF